MPENSDAGLLPHLSAFERIKHQEKDGREWWSARELMLLLTYAKWQDFHKVIQVAIEVYRHSGGEDAEVIFMATRKDRPNGSKKYPQLDYELTRHACYLVVLSADGSKPAVALGKTYFAITTERLSIFLSGVSIVSSLFDGCHEPPHRMRGLVDRHLRVKVRKSRSVQPQHPIPSAGRRGCSVGEVTTPSDASCAVSALMESLPLGRKG